MILCGGNGSFHPVGPDWENAAQAERRQSASDQQVSLRMRYFYLGRVTLPPTSLRRVAAAGVQLAAVGELDTARSWRGSAPSFDGNPWTMILVPAGSEFLFQPFRSRTPGAPPSTDQCWICAVRLLDVEIQPGMRVHPIHLHDRAFELDRLVRIELGGKGMVGQDGTTATTSRPAVARIVISLLFMSPTPNFIGSEAVFCCGSRCIRSL